MKVKDVKFSDTWPLLSIVHLIFYSLCGSQLGVGTLLGGEFGKTEECLSFHNKWGELLTFNAQGLGKLNKAKQGMINLCPSPNARWSSRLRSSSQLDVSLRSMVFSVWALGSPFDFYQKPCWLHRFLSLIWQVCYSFVCSKNTGFSLFPLYGLW